MHKARTYPAGYRQTLEFLYTRLPMYQKVGAIAFKKGLDKTRKLLVSDGNPHLDYPKIHVAGTNGKGTVSHMLAACYQAAGYKVGLYTSPHYRDFRERIKVNGEYIDKSAVMRYVKTVRDLIESIEPSFFEITVAMAFHAFREAQVDLAIIETGLGGRLDSTNVITPVLSVITNIGYDHMDMLGETLPEIAGEKAGIIKERVPVVIGEWNAETAPVFEEVARGRGARLTYADRTLECRMIQGDGNLVAFSVDANDEGLPDRIEMQYGGPFQGRNLTTALCAIHESPITLSPEDVQVGMQNLHRLTSYIGRWQILSQRPFIVCDSAHNMEGWAPVIEHFQNNIPGQKHYVLGFVKGKDIDQLLSIMPASGKYYFCRPDIPRGLDTELVVEASRRLGLEGKAYSSVRRALAAARFSAADDDAIFVGGSSFVVAEVV